MQDVAFAEEAQTEEHLLGVGTDGAQVNANTVTEFFEDFAEVDAGVLG